MFDDLKMGRRGFLKASSSLMATPLVTTLGALYARNAAAAPSVLAASPYGPIAPVNDLITGLPLLQLPAGFTYKSFGWTGDPMSNGQPCPGAHDGMAVVQSRRVGRSVELTLIRNHERGASAQLIPGAAIYDNGFVSGSNVAGGGTTNLVFRDGDWVSVTPSLAGTLVNCAGGPTPWGTWLTCEEIGTNAVSSTGKRHGYVFEVSPDAGRTSGVPIVGMGRFSHEAVAVDPATGYVYLTEDDRNKSGFYRYIPNMRPGSLRSLEQGGRLQMAKVQGIFNADLLAPSVGETYPLAWVDVEQPDSDRGAFVASGVSAGSTAAGPFLEGWAKGALRMSRGEGIWYHAGKMYIVDTSAGRNASGAVGQGEGAVWELDLARMTLTCIFASTNSAMANNPDNITVSPRGGILLCEDGGGVADDFGFGDRLVGLKPDGSSYIFAKNNVALSAGQIAAAGKTVAADDYRDNEFAGACFDPSGRVLFVNIQTPGITFAISGPWARGTL